MKMSDTLRLRQSNGTLPAEDFRGRARPGKVSTARALLVASVGLALASCAPLAASDDTAITDSVTDKVANSLSWKGLNWNLTSGGMAGVAQGSPANISVDGSGYLHLKITKSGNTWTAAEMFTTTNLGFGTYQWQIDGPVDRMDPSVVLGLFPYGPFAGIGADGTNELDQEFSFWPSLPMPAWGPYG